MTIVSDASGDLLGVSVAISANVSTMAIGASSDYNDQRGYVKVYHNDDDGKNRVQLGQTIYGNTANDLFGLSVDFTADGMTMICGSPGISSVNNRPGYMRVFTLEGADDLSMDTWNCQDIKGEVIGNQFGYSVSISEDGKMIAVGANCNNGNDGAELYLGHVRIYRLADDGMSWVKIGQDVDGAEAGDVSGSSVSLSADGSTVAIGAPYNDNSGDMLGKVTVY